MVRSRFVLFAALALLQAGCGHAAGPPPDTAQFDNIGYATWTDEEPQYRLYPGDELDITIPSAPELNKTAPIQPDGRISMPLVGPVMVADRTPQQAAEALSAAYASQLVDPHVDVNVKTAGPLKVFVGGEVNTPGVFDMQGDSDALRAIFQAGGFKTTAKTTQVVVIRRGPNGQAMARTVNLSRALRSPAGADLVPLRRFDIVYVPRSNAAEAALFIQQYFRDLSPIDWSFSYALNGRRNF